MELTQELRPNDFAAIPNWMLQTFKTSFAVSRGVENNLIFRTWGGLGDQICAEPTIRYAQQLFSKRCKVSLASEHPSLFQHLDFEDVFNLKKVRPVYENYLLFDTVVDPSHAMWEFVSHMSTNCVDFASICALRSQLPVASREIKLCPTDLEIEKVWKCIDKTYGPYVAVHAGKHWQSKTFPKAWWDSVLNHLKAFCVPILVGAQTDDNRTTVDVDATGCLDLRGKLSIMESVALLQECRAVVTNDSAPLHMAASGEAFIFYLATCKHPDYITHWRNGQWGWRMKNLSLGGIWDIIDNCPNTNNNIEAENVGDHLLEWLPDPVTVAEHVHSTFL